MKEPANVGKTTISVDRPWKITRGEDKIRFDGSQAPFCHCTVGSISVRPERSRCLFPYRAFHSGNPQVYNSSASPRSRLFQTRGKIHFRWEQDAGVQGLCADEVLAAQFHASDGARGLHGVTRWYGAYLRWTRVACMLVRSPCWYGVDRPVRRLAEWPWRRRTWEMCGVRRAKRNGAVMTCLDAPKMFVEMRMRRTTPGQHGMREQQWLTRGACDLAGRHSQFTALEL